MESEFVTLALLGDAVIILLGFQLAFWLRFHSGLIPPSEPHEPPPSLASYMGLILCGSIVVFGGLLSRELHSYGSLRSPLRSIGKLMGVTMVSLFVFIGFSLLVKTTPAISRAFVVCALGSILGISCLWRCLLGRIANHPKTVAQLRSRVAVVGWTAEARQIKHRLKRRTSMFTYVGWIRAREKPMDDPALTAECLGNVNELEAIIQRHGIAVMVLTDRDLHAEQILKVAKTCELEHVEFKLIPRFFEVLISGLRAGTIGGVPVLGVEGLPLSGTKNQFVKRLVDVVGSLIGLLFGLPLMLVFALLVLIEDPGPLFYTQIRVGRNGRLFRMIKIRSMRRNAEEACGARWASKDDTRRLRVGAFMRKWNIDELPQFWNVLKGDMSLVGPRPERPELISKFKHEIPHYQARHVCHPGMTGWAQVNGWRGNTDLYARIRCDIWYVENWSVMLDLRIMLMTFFRRDNAY